MLTRFWYTSHAATIWQFIFAPTRANVSASWRPRPPHPIRATLMRSLAPSTRPLDLALLDDLPANALVAAPIDRLVAPTDFKKFLRDSWFDMESSDRST